MLILATLTYLAALVAGAPAEAPPACFASEEEFSDWLTYYYLHPQPEKLVCALSFYADSPLYDNRGARMIIAHFYAALLPGLPGKSLEIFDNLSARGSEPARIMALHVYWITNTEESRGFLARARDAWSGPEVTRITGRMAEEPSPENVLVRPVDNPAVLDNLWGVFMATGSEEPVRRIVTALRLREEGKGMEILVGGAAEWSLTSNARQHPRVAEILSSIAAKETGGKKKLLEEILEKARAGGKQAE